MLQRPQRADRYGHRLWRRGCSNAAPPANPTRFWLKAPGTTLGVRARGAGSTPGSVGAWPGPRLLEVRGHEWVHSLGNWQWSVMKETFQRAPRLDRTAFSHATVTGIGNGCLLATRAARWMMDCSSLQVAARTHSKTLSSAISGCSFYGHWYG